MAVCSFSSQNDWPSGLADSKKLSEKRRLELEPLIKLKAHSYGIGQASEKEIDEIGILPAKWLALQRAMSEVSLTENDEVLMDGNLMPDLTGVELNGARVRCEVKADSKYPEVSAASILCKCHSDRWITSHPECERYEWSKNHGYLTARHIELIMKYGKSSIHRDSFKMKGL